MLNRISKLSKLAIATALLIGVGCTGSENKLPAGTPATPVTPIFLFLDLTSDKTSLDSTRSTTAKLAVVAKFADSGAPVRDGTIVSLSTTLGSFNSASGGRTLLLEMLGGTGTAIFFPGTVGGLARIRAELNGVVDLLDIRIEPISEIILDLTTDDTLLVAEGSDTANLKVVAKFAESGLPVADGTKIAMTTDLGAFDSVAGPQTLDVVTFGGVATLVLFPGAVAGTANVQAELNGAIDLVEIIIRAAAIPPPPTPGASTILLTVVPSFVDEEDPATGADKLLVTATVFDTVGKPFKGGNIIFSSDAGTLDSGGAIIKTSSVGKASDLLEVTLADMLAVTGSSFTVTATLGIIGGTASANFEVTIIRGPEDPVAANVLLTVDKSSVPEDGADPEVIDLDALVTDQFGDPLNGINVTFSSGLGTVAPLVVLTAGGGLADSGVSLTDPQLAGHPTDSFTVTATIATASGTDTSTVTITIIRGTDPVPTNVELTASPTTVPQDGVTGDPEVVDLDALVTDQFGDPLNGVNVTFTSQLGTVVTQVVLTAAGGLADSGVSLTDAQLAAHPTNSFTATATITTSTGTDTSTVTITILRDVPLVPTNVVLQSNVDFIVDDGTAEAVDLDAVVTDQFGDPLDGVNVSFSTQLGLLDDAVEETGPLGTTADPLGSGSADSGITVTAGEVNTHPTNSFTITATITTPGGPDTSTVTITIVRPPVADFSFNGASGTDVVNFVDLSTGGGSNTFAWDFDSGAAPLVDSIAQNPAGIDFSTLPAPCGGPFCPVTLTVTNLAGFSSITKSVPIPLP